MRYPMSSDNRVLLSFPCGAQLVFLSREFETICKFIFIFTFTFHDADDDDDDDDDYDDDDDRIRPVLLMKGRNHQLLIPAGSNAYWAGNTCYILYIYIGYFLDKGHDISINLYTHFPPMFDSFWYKLQ